MECIWSQWGSWSRCTRGCGVGIQKRFRLLLVGPEIQEQTCPGATQEVRICNRHSCRSGIQDLSPSSLPDFCMFHVLNFNVLPDFLILHAFPSCLAVLASNSYGWSIFSLNYQFSFINYFILHSIVDVPLKFIG